MNQRVLFWNVDTQVDFIEPTGKLYVPGAEKLKPIYKKITEFARQNAIRVINTCDYHYVYSKELSGKPDFRTTFPEHCMASTKGAEFISETKPELPLIVDWDIQLAILPMIDDPEKYRNIIIRKDAFDVFSGNPYTYRILEILQPQKVFVYGVSTNVCVDRAVCGLVKMGYKVFVFQDAIKELPNIPSPLKTWKTLGVHLIDFNNVKKHLV